jgi:hypothetical protein
MERFQWRVTPMGLGNSVAATVMVLMEVLGKMIGHSLVYCYMDDLAICTRDWDSHIERLKLLFRTLRANNLSLNSKKSTFCENKIKFLGFEVSANGLQIDESRIRLLKSIPVPKDKKSLYRFLGMVTFLRRFVPNFTNKTVHMRTNLRKDAKFNFDNDCLDEFHYIIDQLTSGLVLKPIDASKTFHIYCDASYSGAAYAIFQEHDGQLQPVCFNGRALTGSQRNYTVMQIELFAIFLALKEMEHYIGSQTVRIYSDNISAVYLRGISFGSPREKRMACFLMRFNLELVHIKGKANSAADFLSRCFSDMPEAERIKFLPSNVDSDTDFIMTITGDEPLVDAGNCTDTDEQLCFDSSSKQNDKKDELCYYAVCFSPTENGILPQQPDNDHKNIHKKTGLVLSHDNNLLLAFRVQLHSVVSDRGDAFFM